MTEPYECDILERIVQKHAEKLVLEMDGNAEKIEKAILLLKPPLFDFQYRQMLRSAVISITRPLALKGSSRVGRADILF
jgi:hypothetical protein